MEEEKSRPAEIGSEQSMFNKQNKPTQLALLIVTLLLLIPGAIWSFRNKTTLHDSQPGPTEIAAITLDLYTVTPTSIVTSFQEGTLSVTPLASTPVVTNNPEDPISIPPTLQPSSVSTKPSPTINAIQSRFFVTVSDDYTNSFMPRTQLPQNGQSFPASLDEAEALAGFKIMEPSFLPDGYVLRAIDYSSEDQHIGLLYYKPSNDRSNQVYLLQQRKTFSEHQSIIGTSAIIQESQVNDVPAEYVQGGFDDVGSSATVDRLLWNPFRDLGRLRWENDDYHFQISTGTEIDGSTLLQMAESLKQHIASPNATPLPTLAFKKTS